MTFFRIGLTAMTVCLAVAAPAAAEASSGYVVIMKAGSADALANRHGGTVEHRYSTVLQGFSARMTAKQARSLAADPAVDYVVADTPVRALGEQLNPPWGLDRIDQRTLPLDSRYRYNTTSPNVHAYVIDTGVKATHQDFGGRVSGGYDFVDNDTDPTDGNGHGTFVAGIVGGKTYGVAKQVKIVPVRVLNNSGSGTISGVIAGIDWVTRNAVKPAVANMSLGGSANQALDDAVRRSIASGVTYSVPAGSSASLASNFSPARVAEAITSAAVDRNDCVSRSSNHGPAVDLYAPGVLITGPWITSDTATVTITGTSLAAAHVSGGAALYLGLHPTATPAKVQTALVSSASPGVCNLPPNSPNRILFTGPPPRNF
ncbi:Alkaline serine exoprotease A precursor [Alloactinosynnema sp. L-07]|uniref:S8 family peptidase n=1 Tax=Alloactinosynnema sp. L-07 TaxID=1653480 RepID=UPI00065F0572|nr:S8 family peptidase [Alloactinosynnema sp. L-07]CRK58684.1 Alkaline serine exoprotease A precursor [Alloactinosynnema sp. L-07]